MSVKSWFRRKRPEVKAAPESKDEPSIAEKARLAAGGALSVFDLLGDGAPRANTPLALALQNLAHNNQLISKPTHVGGAKITGDAADVAHAWDGMGQCGSNRAATPGPTDMSPVNEAIFGFLGGQSFIGYQVAAMLTQNWLVQKACEMPARDALRNWLEPRTVDGDELDNADVLKLLRRYDKSLGIKKSAREFLYRGRVFGVRVGYFRVESMDPQYYEKPFNPDSVTPGSYKGFVQIDPYWCVPELDSASVGDPAGPMFYEPTFWRVGSMRIHHSHVQVYRHSNPVDVLKPTYLFGGVPLPQLMMDRIYAAERVANEAPMLALSKRTTVLYMDVKKIAANAAALVDKLANWIRYRDNMGVKLQDTTDKLEQFDTSLADLDVVIMTEYQLVAAAAEVPATKLLGTSPKGFNSTGENEQRNYAQTLESIQENDLSPLVERHHQYVMLSYVVPAMRKRDPKFMPVQTSVVWNPVDTPTAKEQAEINKLDADTDQLRLDQGAIDEYDIREKLITTPGSGYNSLARIDRPEGEDADGDGQPDKRTLTRAEPAAAGGGFGFGTGDAVEVPHSPEVALWTNQTYINPEIVAMKRLARDYTVQVSSVIIDPEDPAIRFRVVIDGHHSLAAARADGVDPVLVEGDYNLSDYMPVDAAQVGG